MREFAGVFFHVHAFDFNAKDLRTVRRIDCDIEVAVEAQRLVVLTDLIILGHIWIEVILTSKATPLRNVAVQR